jgi:hypothetical protein
MKTMQLLQAVCYTNDIVMNRGVVLHKNVDSRLVTGFIFLDYKPQQTTVIGNSFFDSAGSSLGSVSSTLLPGPAKHLGWLGS